jgi:hypothetical protein
MTFHSRYMAAGVAALGAVLVVAEPAAGGTVQLLHVFKVAAGQNPQGRLARDGSGALYGVTSGFSDPKAGTVFRLMPPAGNAKTWGFAVLRDFTQAEGGAPRHGVVVAGDGSLFGVNAMGVFQLTPPVGGSGRRWELHRLYQFGAGDGVQPDPSSAPPLGADGALYGTLSDGGAAARGAIYRLAHGAGIFAVMPPAAGETGWVGTQIAYCGGYATKPLPLADGGLIVLGNDRVCELTSGVAGAPWTTMVLHRFASATEGMELLAGPAGVFCGVTAARKPGIDGLVFSLTP